MATATAKAKAARKPAAVRTVELKPVHRTGPAMLAGRSGDGDGDRDAAPKRELSQREISTLWKYSAGTAVSPVLSPPLRDTPARAMTKDPSAEVENHDLPIKGRGRMPDFSAGTDNALQMSPGPSSLTATGVNFDGLVANGSAPPDSDGHVGPNHYVQWINTQFAIYDKSGTLLYGPSQGNSLFTALGPTSVCANTNDGDPLVVYDPMADRWLLTQFAVEAPPTGQASYQCTAVSVTGDPLGAYYLYEFPLAPNLFFDYPHTGTWSDSYYTTYHVFTGLGTAFVGQGLVAFERPAMIAGLPARFVYTNVDPTGNMFGALPADIDGLTPPPPGEPETILAPGSFEWDGTTAVGTSVLHVWQATTSWGGTPATTLTGPVDVPTSLFNTDNCLFARSCVPEPGVTAGNRLDAISGRLMNRIQYLNHGGVESLLVSHTVNNGANISAVRWYELQSLGSTPTIAQQGTYSPDTNWRWVPSIAMDVSGNVAVGYSKSSATVNPEIDVVGRLASDLPGTLGTESTMQIGLGVQTGTANRWGDYTSMTVDPRDGCTFWYTNQYQPPGVGSFNWKSRIGSFRFAPSECTPAPKGTLTGTVLDSGGTPIAGALIQLSNGFSGATNAAGVYSIVTTPGTYNVSVSAPLRSGCISPPGSVVTINNGAVTIRNFTLFGTAGFALDNFFVDDSIGNDNGVINRDECVIINVEIGNIGCAPATAVSGVLSTSTPGVTVTQNTSAYPNLAAGATGLNLTPFQIATSPTFACGTPIDFTLTVSSASGGGPFFFSVPTCGAPPAVFSDSLTPSDLQENSRLGRNGIPSSCSGKACPGTLGTGTRAYDAYNFTNIAADARCITVTVDAACAPASNGQIFSGAYIGTFDPTQLCLNYAGDLGGSPLNGNSASYSFTVPGGSPFVVIVNESTAGAGCTNYTLHVDGLLDNSDGGRPAPPTAGNNGPVCPGGTLQLTATSIPSATYAWTGPNGFTSNLQNPQITNVTAAAAGTYTVIATVGSCSADAATTNVTVSTAPSATISVPSVVCADSTNNVASVPDAGPGASYVWTITGGTITAGAGTASITFTANSSGTVQLGVTVQNAASCLATGSATVNINATCGNFFTLTPCRVVDTRFGDAPALAAGGVRTFILTGSCGIPSSAQSVSVNVTMTGESSGGNVQVYPGGSAPPVTSTINYNAGQTRANNAIVQVGPGGTINVKCNQGSGSSQFVLDVNGYFE